MAEAVLCDLAGGIISKLASLVLQETILCFGVKDDLGKLGRTVSTIQAVLLDAEQQYSQSHQVKEWVDSLKDAFYDADDLLDEFSTDVLVKQMMTGNKMVKEVRLFFSSSNPFVYGLKMAHKIGKVRSKLDEIVANRNFHLENLPEKTFPMVEERKQTHSSLPQVVVGRENDKKEIIDFLLSSSYRENVSIISIVGLGGLGKTTLAQLAYNDVRVKSYFELKVWVCISENFDVKIVVEKILESLVGKKPKNLEMNTLKDLLWEKINEKKYLLVLDDLWNEDSKKWFDLKDLLARGACGSKIIVTTRLENVAKMIRSDETIGIDKCQQEVIGGHTEDEDFGVTIYLLFDFPFSIENSLYRGIEDLEVLPEDLWHLTSLEGLVVKACEELNLSDECAVAIP
ncbi:hypothetical protein GH714_016589 [Hevea brasiliensis]|uniref:Uncharacterized protein n=1 Tax=Hevea brasiliensis TaxID=3981 RepID=A0A6A6N4K7_HEVBR|nr:hypothetical protein GH714_016589 [Hevea brasiliensis]